MCGCTCRPALAAACRSAGRRLERGVRPHIAAASRRSRGNVGGTAKLDGPSFYAAEGRRRYELQQAQLSRVGKPRPAPGPGALHSASRRLQELNFHLTLLREQRMPPAPRLAASRTARTLLELLRRFA